MNKILGICVGLLLTMGLAACNSSSNAKGGDPGADEKGGNGGGKPRNCIPAKEMDGIIGGTKVYSTDPLSKKVVMLMMTSSEGTSICTGTPIRDNIILTAAHCVKNASKVNVIFHTDITCETGFDKNKQMVEASDFLYHADYSGKADATNDIALVKVKGKIPSNYKVSKIYDGLTTPTDKVVLAGYGVTDESGAGSAFLRTTQKSFKNDITLNYEKTSIEIDQPYNGMCSGDSGGPVFYEVNGDLQVAGVNSFVSGKSKDRICHNKGTSMYAPSFVDWIDRQIPNLR